jgi:hypothetical protein
MNDDLKIKLNNFYKQINNLPYHNIKKKNEINYHREDNKNSVKNLNIGVASENINKDNPPHLKQDKIGNIKQN